MKSTTAIPPYILERWQKHLLRLPAKGYELLEIGVGNGSAALWLLDNVLPLADSYYFGIDSWESDKANEEEITARVKLEPRRSEAKIEKVANIHLPFDSELVNSNKPFDIIYYAKPAPTVLEVLACSTSMWMLTKPDGILIWNDYRPKGRKKNLRVQRAVDAFLSCHEETDYEVIWKAEQLAIRKIGE